MYVEAWAVFSVPNVVAKSKLKGKCDWVGFFVIAFFDLTKWRK